jgi:hypothetical protein
VNDDQVRPEFDDFLCKTLCALKVACGPAIIQLEVAALHPTELAEAIFQGLYAGSRFGIAVTDAHEDANSRRPLGLLCAGHKRPCRSYTAEKRDEFASLHSIIYSSPQPASGFLYREYRGGRSPAVVVVLMRHREFT